MSNILRKIKKNIQSSKGKIVTEKTEILVHGAMYYQCEKCGKKRRMYLEVGLEDKNNRLTSKPVPFIISCKCGGSAKHVEWQNDVEFAELVPLEADMNYFKNDKRYDCGTPVLVN